MKSYSRIICALMLSLVFSSCSDSLSSGSSIGGDSSDNVEVKVAIDRNRIIMNPFNGWVMYSGLGDGLSDNFWAEYDDFDSSVGKVKVSDYSNVLFIRAAWSYFERAEGDYVWDEKNRESDFAPYRRFWMLVDGAKERGMKLAFSLMIDSRDKPDGFTPMYVKDAVVAAGYAADPSEADIEHLAGGYYNDTSSGGHIYSRWSPYPDNPVFQEKFEIFLNAFAERFDNTDEVEYISGLGLGLWGESHTVLYSTGDETNRESVFEWITTAYTESFTKVPCVINYHKCMLSMYGDARANYEFSGKLLDSAVAKGYSLRHDALGMKSYYGSWEKAYVRKWKYKRPVIGEGGWVEKTHGNSPMNSDGYTSWGDVRLGEFNDAKEACDNMLDFRYSKDIPNGETNSWFTDAYNLVEDFISEGGYRLVPDINKMPSSIANNKQFKVETRWRNLGWGYCPNNIPAWNFKYKVAYALLDKNTDRPVYIFIDDSQEVSDFHTSAKSYATSKIFSDLPHGDYKWAIGIVDSSKEGNPIGIQLAAQEDVITDEGWVVLMNVSVN